MRYAECDPQNVAHHSTYAVWLEAARLHPPDLAQRILATAARTLPHQVKLFFQIP